MRQSLRSAQDGKERAASIDAGETVLLTNDKLSPCLRGTSNKVAEGVLIRVTNCWHCRSLNGFKR